MSSYKELLAKRAELDAQIEKARRAELDDAIRQARELVAQFNLTPADIFGSGAGAAFSSFTGAGVDAASCA